MPRPRFDRDDGPAAANLRFVRRFSLFLVGALVVVGALVAFLAGGPRLSDDGDARSFDLDTGLGRAQLIVRGTVDGADRLTVSRCLREIPPGPA